MSDPAMSAPADEKKIVVNKIMDEPTNDDQSDGGGAEHGTNDSQNGSHDESQSEGGTERAPLSAESKAKLDAMDLMDATEFGLAPNPEQSGGSNNDGIVSKKNLIGGSSMGKMQTGGKLQNTDSVNNTTDSQAGGGNDDDADTVVVDTDGEPATGDSSINGKMQIGGKRKPKKTRKRGGGHHMGNSHHSRSSATIVDVALPMGGKAVVPFSMPKSLNIADIKRKFENQYKEMRAMKPESRRRRLAELEAIIFEDPSANDLANGLLDIIDDRAIKCMAMKAVLAKGL